MAEIKNRFCSCCGIEIKDFWAFKLIRVSDGREHLTKNSFFSLDLCESCKRRLEKFVSTIKAEKELKVCKKRIGRKI